MNKAKHTALAFAAVLSAGAVCAGAQTSHDLPDIGDPAASGLPLSQERRLGPVILRQLRSQLSMVEDVELNEYLSSLGSRLLSADAGNQLDFHFLLAEQAQINAFATPGGIIAINSGLMRATESESELAGVLAHEITHVTRRHLARRIAESRRTGWVGYLAVIGAVLAAVYNSRLAQAGAFAGLSLPVERALAYSRTFEHEADRFGMELMVAAGYDPVGMPRFFERLQARERRAGGKVPEFLRTHPLTTERLSGALSRAALYRGKYRGDSEEFVLARARVEALTDPQRVLSREAEGHAGQYRRAVALTRVGRAREAVRLLEGVARDRESVATGLALAEAHLAQGDHRAAIALLEPLAELHPGRESVAYHLGHALLRGGRSGEALARLRPFAHRRHTPGLDKLLAEAAAAEGNVWLSHKHLADYYQANGHMQAALDQLTLAGEDPRINSPARELIKAERGEIEKLRADMEKDLK